MREIHEETFTRVEGRNLAVSATDAVLALTALLQHGERTHVVAPSGTRPLPFFLLPFHPVDMAFVDPM